MAAGGAKRCGREAACDKAKGWTFLIDTKYEMKWGMSDGEWLACICNRRTPLMLNDKNRKARDKYKLKQNLNTTQTQLTLHKCNSNRTQMEL